MFRVLLLLVLLSALWACHPKTQKIQIAEHPGKKHLPQESSPVEDSDLEAREDSIELAKAYANQAKIKHAVTPDIETHAINARSEDDAADDPAIWVNHKELSKSLIFGSNKRGGLAVYNLAGEEIAYHAIGNINNVDILYDFPLGEDLVSIVGCSNRSHQSIDLFKIDDASNRIQNITEDTLFVDTALIDDIYGFCFAHDQINDKYYTVINGKNGLLQQFEMIVSNGAIHLDLKRQIQFDSQTEGMVADNEAGFLYVGEENKGIWKLPIAIGQEPTSKSFVMNSDSTNPNIFYDIEGLTIYKKGNQGYLIASSQGNFSYAIFDLSENNNYLASFKIVDAGSIDGVEETDGLDVVSDSLGTKYPNGLIVLQDGFNYLGDSIIPQNFKYLSWTKVDSLLKQQ